MMRECNCVVIRHNSQELQDKLKALGYIDLKWTVNLEPEQLLIASSYKHTVKGYQAWPNERIPDKHYNNSFWNGGIAPPRPEWNNAIDVQDDEELFIKYAEMLTRSKYLQFEGNQLINESK